jgi:hypothetical protein
MQYLSSDESRGRYPGTEGNEKAAEYICKNFEQYGLLPWKGTYFSPSEITLRDTENMVNISLIGEDRTIREFDYGKDFIQRLPQKCNLSLPLTKDPKIDDCILLLNDSDDMEKYLDLPNVQAFFIYSNILFKKNTNIVMDDNLSGKPYYIISEGMYKILKENYGNIIRINSSYVDEKILTNNVIGKLEGKNKDSVLVISAHFDHVGSIGDQIWNGAIDNASGVSSLMELARNFDKESIPECDILFCAFNCEEAHFIGSKDIYLLVQNEYKNIYNLNIDCIGGKEINEIVIDRNNASDSVTDLLCEKLIGRLNELGLKSKLTVNTIPSDHTSFPNGIGITSDTYNKYLHTTHDKLELIDMEYLNKITEAIQAILPDLLKVITINEVNSEEKVMKDITAVKNGLKLGEYCYVTIENETRLVYNNNATLTLDEFEDKFMIDLSFANAIFDDEYTYIHTSLGQTFRAAIENNEKVTDKIYKDELNVRDLFQISFKSKEINENNPIASIEFIIFNMQNEVDTENYEMMTNIKAGEIFDINDMSLKLVVKDDSNPKEEVQFNTLTTELNGERTNIVINLSLNNGFNLSRAEDYLQKNNIASFITTMGEEIFKSIGETIQ